MKDLEKIAKEVAEITDSLPEKYQEIAFGEFLKFQLLGKLHNEKTDNETPIFEKSKTNAGSLSNGGNEALVNFAQELSLSEDLIVAALSPSENPPYFHLDSYFWAAYKKSVPTHGTGSLHDSIFVLSALLLWKKHIGIEEEIKTRLVNQILATIDVNVKNSSRALDKNTWLRKRNGKIVLNPVEIEKAIEIVKAYCEKRAPKLD